MILETTKHRPYPLPEGNWIAEQLWQDLLFAHWSVEIEALAPFIPTSLELDTRNGKGWITISPFRISGARIRYLPLIPFTHTFLELNVRTYVIHNGIPGIYFFSIDASNLFAVTAARFFNLPYHKAMILMNEHVHQVELNYNCKRKINDKFLQTAPLIFQASYSPRNNQVFQAEAGTDIHWLTERYRLYSLNKRGNVMCVDIHHCPWQLQHAYMELEKNTILDPFGLILPSAAQLVTYTKQLHALLWPMRQL